MRIGCRSSEVDDGVGQLERREGLASGAGWSRATKRSIKSLAMLGAIALSTALVACGSSSSSSTSTSASGSTGSTASSSEAPKDGPFTIGVSNGFLGSPWRTAMLNSIQAANKPYEDKGITKPLVVQSATTDVPGQIRQIQTLMNQGVDAILVDVNSPNALNPILNQAVARGIKVIAFDNMTDNPKVVNLGISQAARGATAAKFIADQMGGKGNMVIVGGQAGAPASDDRDNAVKKVIADQYPDIKIVQTLNGNWDLTTGNQVMSTYLASHPTVNGVFTQDGGQAHGVLQALVNSGIKPLPAVNGEDTAGWVKYADQVMQKNPGWKPFTDFSLPVVGADALEVAVRLLQGKTLNPSEVAPGNQLIVPQPVTINPDNFDHWLSIAKTKPDSFTLSPPPMSAAEIDKWFNS